MEFSNDASDVDIDYEESVNSSEESFLNRPNRFKGPSSTWRNLIEGERLVSSSITQLRSQDLSAHLYNAHAMKKRQIDKESASKLKSWANKDRWRGNRDAEDDEDSTNFVPPKSWTAWPLSADIVPRTCEEVGPKDDVDGWTLKRRELQRPSRELEDALMAITLRISKDRFEKREWEISPEHEEVRMNEKEVDMNLENDSEVAMVGERSTGDVLQVVQSGASEISSEEAQESQETPVRANRRSIGRSASREAAEQSDHSSAIKDRPKPLSDKAPGLERPIVSADDERSRKLLRPTIRHSLLRLDELLMALHNARQNCLYYASEHTESQTEVEGGDESSDDGGNGDLSHPSSSTIPIEQVPEQPAKRSGPGRPPKALHMPAPSSLDRLESIEPEKKETRGRKRKLHVPLEGETHEEMLVRIARLQKKALPFTSGPNRSASSSPAKSARGGSQKRGTSAHTREKRSMRLGLRDWGEIIGTAALIGFSPSVIDRATQRCANLFGEGMTMLSLVENPTSGNEDRTINYLPEEIPNMDNLDNYSITASESENEVPQTGRRPSRGRKRNMQRSENEMNISEPEEIKASSEIDVALYCPYARCLRHNQGFTSKKYLESHLQSVHKLGKGDLKEVQGTGKEEMEGAVHVDGFLKHVVRRTGWRSVDGYSRRRRSGSRMKTEEPGEEGLKGEGLREESGDDFDESGRDPDDE